MAVDYPHVKLTERQAWMLDQVQRSGIDGWFRPMDVGGRDASDHSNILVELCRKGLIERRLRMVSGRSYFYRLTDAGREWQD